MNLDFRKLRRLERSPISGRVRGTRAQKKPSWAPIKSRTEGSPGGTPLDVQGIQQVQTDLPDIVLLCRTLVADGGLPGTDSGVCGTTSREENTRAQQHGRSGSTRTAQSPTEEEGLRYEDFC